MGEVYRARDTRLNRAVAIKVLLPGVAADQDRLARFNREAQHLAALNHPHIAQIYGVEDSGDGPALVMELVEGPTLAERIAQGAIPMDEALPIAKQIAEAIEAAHERGIVHRDLKPANIKAGPDGTVKVLDFGLAKALDPADAPGVDAMNVRAIDRLEAQLVAGVTNGRQPFLSPDGQWIGFVEGTELRKVSIAGGAAITIGRLDGLPRGASWGDDNMVVFATSDSATGLRRVSAGGGEPTVLTTPDAAQHERNHFFPSVLPGGRGVLFTIIGDTLESAQVAVLDLKSGQRKTLIRGGSQAEYVETGHLVYASADTLRAVRFDLARLEVLSDPVPVIEHLMVAPNGAANYAVSRAGALVYASEAPQTPPRSLVWSTGKASKHRSRRRRERTERSACRRTARARPSVSSTRRTTSGSGILRANGCRG